MDDGRLAIDTPTRQPASVSRLSMRVVALVPPLVALVVGALILSRGTGLWGRGTTAVARLPRAGAPRRARRRLAGAAVS